MYFYEIGSGWNSSLSVWLRFKLRGCCEQIHVSIRSSAIGSLVQSKGKAKDPIRQCASSDSMHESVDGGG
jgi:hypothetical protein